MRSKARVWLLGFILAAGCEGTREIPEEESTAAEEIPRPSGLVTRKPGASPGYILYAPLLSDTTYLIDADGLVVHMWKSPHAPQGSVYLTNDGRLLRGARVESKVFRGGGTGGRIEEYDWEGELSWSYPFATDDHVSHHDIEPLPGGNILAIAWERKTAEEAKRAGRRPDVVPEQGVWPDKVVEIEPRRPEGGRIVWEWHAWDHLIQNVDPELPNYGDPATHPHRIDINGDGGPKAVDPEELAELKALGYVSEDTDASDLSSDLFHTNAVAYNEALDQIGLSTPNFSEIWILDHGTTTAEARTGTGGRFRRGGDLLYRWGNPAAYGRHENRPRQLFAQHDVRWIPDGLPGAGRLTIFNNDVPGPGEKNYSQVVEIAPPVDEEGRYLTSDGGPFGPDEPAWKYEAPDQTSFYSDFISGAQRLPNGNTLICQGRDGRIFEVTPDGEIVWDYWTPYSGTVTLADGSQPQPVEGFTYAVFRATKIPPDHPALEGRELAPLDPQPVPIAREYLAEEPEKKESR
ncbi:MAG TPA: aryl-sulfate sulfotransferase [Vicinamibacteria bacterium]|nr:aryl-sulfate sulfotransferase [Vicinamibacteria bacterium]